MKTVRTKTKAIAAMIAKTLQDHLDYGLQEIVVHHINCYDQAKELANNLRDKLKMDVTIADIGPVLSLIHI